MEMCRNFIQKVVSYFFETPQYIQIITWDILVKYEVWLLNNETACVEGIYLRGVGETNAVLDS